MNNIIYDIRAMLIQNLASSAARTGGLSENEAQRLAESLVDRILQSEGIEFDDLEQLITDPSATDLYLKGVLTNNE